MIKVNCNNVCTSHVLVCILYSMYVHCTFTCISKCSRWCIYDLINSKYHYLYVLRLPTNSRQVLFWFSTGIIPIFLQSLTHQSLDVGGCLIHISQFLLSLKSQKKNRWWMVQCQRLCLSLHSLFGPLWCSWLLSLLSFSRPMALKLWEGLPW